MRGDRFCRCDIGCGSGGLVRLIRRTNPRAVVVGLDVTLAELRVAAAADRVPDASLVCARAQAVPLATASVDCVLSHMALMLMDDPDGVLAEVRRILRADGMFSAVVERRAPLDAIARAVLAPLRTIWDTVDPELLPPTLGDERVSDAAGLERLIASHFSSATVEPFELAQEVPRSDLWSFLRQRFYGLDVLPEADVREALRKLELPDRVPWCTPMLHVSARSPRPVRDRDATDDGR